MKISFDRLAIVDAYVTFANAYKDKALTDRLHGSRACKASNASLYSYRESVWEAIDSLDEEYRPDFYALVAKRKGAAVATQLEADYARIQDPAGVVIHLETSDDDPTRCTAHIHDVIADAWCNAHGSLDGGTWECCDGPEFCYDILNWHPGQIEALQAQGYRFDFSAYSEPNEHDIAVMSHASECEDCQWDYRKGEKHLADTEARPLFNQAK